ncbi:MAG: ATP-binding protein [Bdellovibrionales bacterium]|nr:ATP-binding protein [Bdellovibrionales bacterium]
MNAQHLQSAQAHILKAVHYREVQAYDGAHKEFLAATRHMLNAAKECPMPLKLSRREQAEKLHRLAEEMKLKQAASSNTRGYNLVAEESGEPTSTLGIEQEEPIRFSEIAGLDEVKEQVRLKVIYPFEHRELAERYRIHAGGGILFYGPPGVGKTLFARAVAGELGVPFFQVKASDILSKFVGEAEKNIAKLFEAARSLEKAVIFIDEVEKLLPKRGATNSSVMPRVVSQILEEVDGFQGRHRGLLLLGNTNTPWLIDEAMLRPGRFDETIYIPMPDSEARREICRMNLVDVPMADDVSLDELALNLDGYSGADIAHFCYRACSMAFMDAIEHGDGRLVTAQDFAYVLERSSPSVSPKTLARFVEFQLSHA